VTCDRKDIRYVFTVGCMLDFTQFRSTSVSAPSSTQ